MPLYDFICECGHTEKGVLFLTVELEEKLSPLVKCPKCHKKMTRELGTPSPPQFKGKGFYETDYKTKDKK